MNKDLFSKDNIIKGLKWFLNSFIWLFVLLFVLDIVSKTCVLNYFGGWELFSNDAMLIEANKNLALHSGGFMSIELLFNTGAAWGAFKNLDDAARRGILISISIIMTIAFVGYYIWKFKKLNNWYKAFLMALAAGAFGNFIDRAFYPNGKVIDFLKFDFFDFPTFNIADAVLVVTIIMMLIYMIVEEIREHIAKQKAAAAEANAEISSVNEIVEEIKNNEEKVDEKSDEKSQNLCRTSTNETKVPKNEEKIEDKNKEEK